MRHQNQTMTSRRIPGHLPLRAIGLALLFLAVPASLVALGGQKVGTTQAQFLKIGPGAEATGLAGAAVSILQDASALYWNPGIVSFFRTSQAYVNHTDWFLDVAHEWVGLVIPRRNAVYGVQIGALLAGYIEETDENHPFGTGRYFNNGGLYLGLTYARTITDRFGYGLTLKFIQETLADVQYHGAALDIGTLYNVGYRDIKIGVVLSHLGPDLWAPRGYEGFSLPITYRMGVSGQLTRELYGVLQLEKPSDEEETARWGLEFRPTSNFRLYFGYNFRPPSPGYSFPPTGASAGLSLSLGRLTFEYSITGYGYLPAVSRWSLAIQ